MPVRVLMIAGTGRSGSTLLGNALGASPRVFSAGEIRFAWERGLAQQGTCGCRRLVRECPVWQSVFEEAFGSLPTPDEAAAFHARLTQATRLRTLPRYLRGQVTDEQRELAATITKVHNAIAKVTGAEVVVDSSKQPTFGALLATSDSLDRRVIHLVRDPRATAFSWQRPQASYQAEGFAESVANLSTLQSTLLWTVTNAAVPLLFNTPERPVLRIRYEDLVTSPESTLKIAFAHADLVDAEIPFETDGTLTIPPSHNIAGNPNRLRHGTTRFSEDIEWKAAMKPLSRAGASLISWPVRRKFGYRW